MVLIILIAITVAVVWKKKKKEKNAKPRTDKADAEPLRPVSGSVASGRSHPSYWRLRAESDDEGVQYVFNIM